MGVGPNIKSKSPHYFYALDGFRGVLALMVAIYHTMWFSYTNSTAFFDQGQILVDLFFVFSGFLMFILYDGRISNARESMQFMKRRLARLYPLHLFMLCIAVAYAALRVAAHYFGFATLEPGEILPFQPGAQETMATFYSHLLLTHSMGLHDSLSYNMPSWTVSVEFYTYFVFIAVMMFARPRKAWHFALIAALLCVNYLVLAQLKPNMDFHHDLGFFRCLGGFFTGVIGAYLFRNSAPLFQDWKRSRRQIFAPLTAAAEILLILMLILFVIYCPGKAQFFFAPVALLFVLGFAYDAGPISKFLSAKIFRYLAKISYSVYLVHIVMALIFGIASENILPQTLGADWAVRGGGDLLLVVYLVSVIAAAHLTYHLVEVPGRRAINNFEVRRSVKNIYRAMRRLA